MVRFQWTSSDVVPAWEKRVPMAPCSSASQGSTVSDQRASSSEGFMPSCLSLHWGPSRCNCNRVSYPTSTAYIRVHSWCVFILRLWTNVSTTVVCGVVQSSYCPKNPLCRFLCRHQISTPLGKYQRVQLLGHAVSVPSSFLFFKKIHLNLTF